MEFNVGKVGINLGGWYGIYLGGKGSLSVYTNILANFRILVAKKIVGGAGRTHIRVGIGYALAICEIFRELRPI